jgi:transposase|tara:strand:- start:434 stop:1498 length:1065 start_codon:yes stop_codon:yes gene_type:complete
MRSKSIDFTGKNIYVGLDVHKKSWSVTVLLDELEHRTFSSPPVPEVLSKYLTKNFPGGTYLSAYECGFSGYGHHRRLHELGIKNIVINPADVPSSNKEKTTKTDKVDSRKIAKGLRNGELRGIHVFDLVDEEFRSLVRQRTIFTKDLRRSKQRIKSSLMYHGIEVPEELDETSWGKAFEYWLAGLEMSTSNGTQVLENLYQNYLFNKNQIRVLAIDIKKYARRHYKEDYFLLRTIPGIGQLTAVAIISELGDINRFKHLNHLCSYVGLMPMSYNSGESEQSRGMTYRANNWVRTMLVEASWQAIRKDPAMTQYYLKHAGQINGKKAIIKVSRKLLNRVRYVLKNKQPYEIGIQD